MTSGVGLTAPDSNCSFFSQFLLRQVLGRFILRERMPLYVRLSALRVACMKDFGGMEIGFVIFYFW